jgi:hypothetical protein
VIRSPANQDIAMNSSTDPTTGRTPNPRQSTGTITARLLGVFAFNDFDIEGHESIKRVTVGHRMSKGDMFNVYHHSGAKVGGTWMGTLRKTLDALLGGAPVQLCVGPDEATHVDPKGFFWRQFGSQPKGQLVWQRFCTIYGWAECADRRLIDLLQVLPTNPLAPSVLIQWAGPDNLALADVSKGA